MSDKAVARRYAQALFELASDKGVLDQTQGDLEQVVKLIDDHEDFKTAVHHRLLSPKKKQDILSKVFSGQISQLVLNFLCLVVEKRREDSLVDIKELYENYANEARNLLKAEIEAARELNQEELAELKQALESKTGKNIIISQRIEPSLKGGVRVRVGDTIYDGSVATRLDLLKQRLVSAELG